MGTGTPFNVSGLRFRQHVMQTWLKVELGDITRMIHHSIPVPL